MNRFSAVRGMFTAFVLVLAAATSAEAHRLKLFVSVEGMTMSGHAFFIGGGRPQDVGFVVKDASGAEIHRGRTDDQGAFSWTATKPADYVLSVDTGDGHFADEKIPTDRFSPAAQAAAAPMQTVTSPAPVADVPANATAAVSAPAPVDTETLARRVEAAVDRAVARQLRPLIEAQNLAEGRLRFNDIMGGVGMIIGLAGIAAWALSRRRKTGDEA
jgi:nickel transport protein